MHTPPPPPACLLSEIAVACSYVLAVKVSPPDVEMARLVAQRYGGESASVPGCLCDGTGALFHRSFCDMTIITPLQFACSGKVLVLRSVYLSIKIRRWKKNRRQRFYAARLRRPLSNDVPEPCQLSICLVCLFLISETL